jgi:GH25 family lysozyme M1 (1,4-beta-N-acetylmuramidase)
MGQTDVASLLYADDANASFIPQWLAKVDGLHPHLAQQMADAREFHQSSSDGISP